MAVAFDAKATAATALSAVAATNTIANMTIGANATALVVFVARATNGASTTLSSVSGVTWNGVAMTLIATKLQSNSVAGCDVFGLASPATGNHSLVVSFTGGTLSSTSAYVDAASFTGTATTTATAFPSANVLTDASTPSTSVYPTTAFSVTSASGDAACSVMQCQANNFSTAPTDTLIRNATTIDGNYSSAYKLATTTATSMQFASGAAASPAAGIAFRVVQSSGGVTGTLATTEAKDTAAFAGSVADKGTLATTETADHAAFAGNTIISGLLATTEAADILAFAGVFGNAGALATAETPDAAAFSGTLSDQGSLATTENTDTAAFAGAVSISGTLVTTDSTDVAAFAGAISDQGALATMETADVAALTGAIVTSGALVTTEATDILAFVGGGAGVSGTLASIETPDAAAFIGAVVYQGALATSEAKDIASFVGAVSYTGALAATEAKDIASFAGVLAAIGAFAAVETQDDEIFIGFVSGGGANPVPGQTYAQNTRASRSSNANAPACIQVGDTDLCGSNICPSAGSWQGAMSRNSPILCKNPDGSQSWYRIDAERTIPGVSMVLIRV